MLLHSVTVDQAHCFQDQQIVFSSDKLSTDGIDVGTIDIANRSVSDSVFRLNSLSGHQSSSSAPSQVSGLKCCKSKVIVYSSYGLFSCHDMPHDRSIPYLGVNVARSKSKQTPIGPASIRWSCASRVDDDLCFFASVDSSISVMHFTGKGQNEQCSARMTQPFKVDTSNTSPCLGKVGITALQCHPTLPFLFVMGADGVFVWCYTNLLQRLSNEYSTASDGNNNEDSSTKDEDDNDSENGSNTAEKATGPRRILGRGIFRNKSSNKIPLADFVCMSILVAPPVPSAEAGSVGTAFKMSVHTGGAFLSIMWKWGSSSTNKLGSSSTTACVYDVRSPSIFSTAATPVCINPIASNNMKGVGSGTKTLQQQAVFSICFHPTEPLLLVGLISRLSPGSVHKQLITICSLTLLEPSMRVVGLQNIDPPVLRGMEEGSRYLKEKGINKDTHASEIHCDPGGGFVLILFKHSEMTSDDPKATRTILRPVTLATYVLSEEWRRACGCTSSTTIITQMTLPTASFINMRGSAAAVATGGIPSKIDKEKEKEKERTGGDSFSRVGRPSRTGRTVLAVRPLGEISLSGDHQEIFCTSPDIV